MPRVMVRYKTKPEYAGENQKLVEAVYEELARDEPEGLRYATMRLDDGVTFVHIADIDAEEGRNPLGDTTAFKRFQEGIAARCVEPPVAYNGDLVGSFRMFAD